MLSLRNLFVPAVLLLSAWGTLSGQGVVTTVAGTDWLFPGDGLPAVNAPLSASNGPDLAYDLQGNLYICDLGNAMIMRVSPDGVINVVAGNGLVSVSGDGGPAVNASFYLPTAVTVDSSGNIYVVDSIGTIRKVTPDGVIHALGGVLGESGYRGDGGPASQAVFNAPYGVAVDANGAIYIADTSNYRIRKITPDGIVQTIAGTGVAGSGGDGGPATAATLLGPSRIALDGKGNIYFVDLGTISQQFKGTIRKIDSRGIITTVAGGGARSGDGIPATQSSLVALALAIDPAGNLYIADRQTSSVRKVDLSGIVTTIAGSGVSGFGGDNGPALKARFAFNGYPSLAIDPKGNVVVGDEGNGRVRRVDSAGVVTTIAGNGLFRFAGNGGPATSATLYLPFALAQDAAGDIFVSEPTYGRIRRVATDGTISVYAGNGTLGYSGDGGQATNASLSGPEGLAIAPDGSLIFADTSNCVVRRIDTHGVISTIVGTGKCGFGGDGGPALNAQLNSPVGVTVDGAGNLAITETDGNRVRVVISGTIQTIAGNGVAGYSGDGGDSLNAQVSYPTGIRINNGYLYFCDADNNVVRRINLTSARTIETVVGNGRAGFSGDGGPAKSAALDSPDGLTFDGGGNLYIADANNDRIRRVAPDGTISTFAGGGQYTDDGVPSTFAVMTPFDVLQSSTGDLLFTDVFFNRIRSVLSAVPSFQASPNGISLTAAAGSTATAQTLGLSGSIPGVLFTATGDQPWLQVSPVAGAMPSSVVVNADAASLAAGTYKGNVMIEAIAKPFTQAVPVSLTVTAPGQPSLRLSTSSLQFSFVEHAGAVTRVISVSNNGGGSLPFTLRLDTVSGGAWLASSVSTGNLGSFGSASVSITANPGQLPSGTYSGTVTVSSDTLGQKVIVPVTMTVTAVQQTILIPQTGLAFTAVQGNSSGSVLPQFFSILNTGQGQMSWRTSAQTLTGGNWLSAFPATGVTDAAVPLVPQVRVDINPSGLAPGPYYGMIQVSAPGADNSPQVVSVALNVLPPGSNAGPVLQPSGLIFTGVAGGETPGSQTLLIQNTSGAPLTFTSGRVTANNAILFDPLPGSGTVTGALPFRMIIQPKTDGLAAGVYRGTMTLSFSDGSSRNVALVLVLTPSGSNASAVGLSPRAALATGTACKPSSLVPVFLYLSDGSSIPTGYPGQLGLKVLDDCGNPMVSGGVSVTFTNGDPPVGLTSLKDGSWAATWTPQHQTSMTVVTARATIPEQSLKGEIAIRIGLQNADQTPVILTAGVVNAASFSGQALAPGSLIALFGSKLAQAPSSATAIPLPSTLGGGSIVIAGKQTPLLYASDGQVNAVIPYGISTNTTQQVLASRGNSLSVPQPVVIAPAAPGIFTTDGKQAIIVNLGNSIADTTHPVTAGDFIIIYCTGLGEVNPPVTAGQAAPASPLSVAVNTVTVNVGGVDARVTFAGLTPGLSGLYQINAVVPAGVTPGPAVPVVVTAAGQASAPATIAVR